VAGSLGGGGAKVKRGAAEKGDFLPDKMGRKAIGYHDRKEGRVEKDRCTGKF